MRGGERLVKECGWMSGICLRFHRLTGIFETIRYRCPSSVFFTNRCRSADCQKIQLPLGGSQGVEDLRFYHSTNGSVAQTFGRILSAPTERMRSTGYLRKTGVSGGFYPPPTRAYRLKVCTTWLPPGGSCQTALRNRLTDEGRRTVGQEMQLDERYMFQIVPFNREIQNF